MSHVRPNIDAIMKCRAILDSADIPKDTRSAFIAKSVFLGLGGTIEAWDSIEGDDGYKLIQLARPIATKED